MKTQSAKRENVERKWYVVDAEQAVLGRISTQIATILRGKNKPTFTPHVDTGDFVVVINADKVKLTGRKETDKLYHHHTGWVGGLVTKTAAEIREKAPEDLIKKAVWGMLPHGPLGRQMFKKLKVYAGGEHPHAAQEPETLVL
ncbi:MAG: 50S ribosomal protein L13 [Myxococcota bacterium]|nr:50S ribosomal protein L13 [Myxococcota bacterium]